MLLEWPSAVPDAPASLTRSELAVLVLVRAGLSNGEVAARRGRSARTVANQVASIFAKLGVRSRLELFALAARSPGAGVEGS